MKRMQTNLLLSVHARKVWIPNPCQTPTFHERRATDLQSCLINACRNYDFVIFVYFLYFENR